MSPRRLLILGCGFTGTEVARRAIAAGHHVVATTRQADRRETLEQLGVELHVVPALTGGLMRQLAGPNVEVLVAFAPDGRTDPEIAAELTRAGHVVYISTTGVYGARRGRIDEMTPVDPAETRARERIAAEQCYRAAGATVLRAAGIYGPGRGLHLRLQSGTFRIPGDGTGVVSRIHVADLAEMVLAVFRGAREKASDGVFVAADDAPVPQIEAIEWLCRHLGIPMPPHVPIADAPETLRHDRAIDNRRIKAWAGLSLLYPSYREGFAACLAAESLSRAGSAAPPE